MAAHVAPAAYRPPGYDPDSRFRWIVLTTAFGAESLAAARAREITGCAYLPLYYDPPRTPTARRQRLHRARARASVLHRSADPAWLRRMMERGKLTAGAALDGATGSDDPDVIPVFSGYIFALIDPDVPHWRALRRGDATHGIRGIVEIAGAVGTVPQSCLDRLWRQSDADGVIRPAAPPTRIQPGASVRVLRVADAADAASPIAGAEGICQQSRRDRIALLHTWFGRETVTWVPRAHIEVIPRAAE